MDRSKKRGKRRNNKVKYIALGAFMLVFIAACVIVVTSLTGREGALDRLLSNWTGKKVYPVRYEEEIRAASAEFGLTPAYIASVILAESSYDPQAVSSADARGLMQLLPSTAEWVAGKLGEPYSEEALYDPLTNIRMGSWYLSFLMNRYKGDMRLSSAAYHAGQGTVDKWLKDPELSSDGVSLDVINSKATNTYVNRVLANYEEYSKIY